MQPAIAEPLPLTGNLAKTLADGAAGAAGGRTLLYLMELRSAFNTRHARRWLT